MPPSEPNAMEFLESGKREFADQSYKGAIDSLTRAIELDASLSEAFYYRASAKENIYAIQHKKGEFDGLRELRNSAFDDVNEAIRLNADYVDAYILRGDIFGHKVQSESAIEDLEKALKLAPESVAAMLKLAEILSFSGPKRWKDGLTILERVTSIDPTNETAIGTRLLLHKLIGNKKEAIEDLSLVIAKDPGNALHYCERAKLREGLRDCDGALADLDSACEISDSFRSTRAKSHMHHRRFDLAEKDLLYVIENEEEKQHARETLATLYFGLEKFSEALELLNNLLEVGRPESMITNWYLTRSLIHLRLGNGEKALQDCNVAISRNVEDGKMWNDPLVRWIDERQTAFILIRRGTIHSFLKDHKLAEADFNLAYKVMSPENYGIFDKLRDSFMSMIDSEFESPNPKDYSVLGNLGEAYIASGDYKSAVRTFSELLRTYPQSGRAYYQRGMAYMKLKMTDKALSDFSKCIVEQPNNVDALNARAEIYELKGERDSAANDRKASTKASASTHLRHEEFNESDLFFCDGGLYA